MFIASVDLAESSTSLNVTQDEWDFQIANAFALLFMSEDADSYIVSWKIYCRQLNSVRHFDDVIMKFMGPCPTLFDFRPLGFVTKMVLIH